jgi:HTH-type transcriptional regulator, quorum sensing regulator NprR
MAMGYFKRKQHNKAHHYYGQTLLMADVQSSLYLNRLFNYIDNAMEGHVIPQHKLLQKAHDGHDIAVKLKNPLYQHLFTIILLQLETKWKDYYSYIDQSALPFFQSHHHLTMLHKYGRKLYHHYVTVKEFEKAVQVAEAVMIGR